MRFWSWVGGLTLLSAVLTANGAEVAKKIPSDDGQALRPLDNMAVTSALTQLAPTPSTTAETTYQGEKHFLVAETHYQPPPLEPGAQIPGVKVDRLNQTVGGIRVRAMLAWPSKGRPTAAALIIHEWWGLNPAVELEAQRLAGQGFKVLAIDLYGGELAEGRREAAKLARRAQEQSDQTRAMLKAALGYLAKPEGGKTLKVAVIGWGLGAGWALRLAAADTRPAAVVVFHGELPRDPKQLARLSCPILGVFGLDFRRE